MIDQAKITAAAEATAQTVDLVQDASSGIIGGHFLNGYGIFADPSAERAKIRDAISRLTRAEKLMAETKWPTPEDYGE